MKVVAYVRVSTKQQARDGHSIAAQTDRLHTYCKLYDLELVSIEIDRGTSAKPVMGRRTTGDWRAAVDRRRPALGRALGYLDRGEADGLVVFKLGRLTRSHRDLDELLGRYFSRKKALFSVTEQVDTRTAAGRLVLSVLMSVLQWERETTCERTASIAAWRKEQGLYLGGPIPYGFAVEGKRKKEGGKGRHLVPDVAEQAVIGVARQLRVAGLPLRRVAEELARMGHVTRGGSSWHPQQIARLLVAA